MQNFINVITITLPTVIVYSKRVICVKCMARTIQEKAIDRLLTLYVVNRCSTKHNIKNISETKMHKLMFYSEKKLIEKRIKALNYRFVKVLYPTFSDEHRTDLNEMAQLGFLDGPFFSENNNTRMILEDFQEVLDNNRAITSLIDSEVDKYAPIPTEKLVAQTQEMPWRTKTIGELKKGTPLIFPLKSNRAMQSFNISPEDFEDLAICLSPKVTEVLESANDEMRRGKRLTHEEVFG